MYFDLSLFLSVVILTFVFGMCTGAVWSLKKYKSNRFFSVLPGQIWLLHGVGLVRIVHSSQPGSEVLYLYNIEKSDAVPETGVCDRQELISNGVLLVEDDPDIRYDEAEEEPLEKENIINFPYSIGPDDEFDN